MRRRPGGLLANLGKNDKPLGSGGDPLAIKFDLNPTDTACQFGRCSTPEEPTGLAWILAVGLLGGIADGFSVLPIMMLMYMGGAFN